MSIYAGLSLREIYVRQCADLKCKSNSSLRKSLPDIPDDYISLKHLDLSKNYLGPKGILPLLEVVHCCKGLRTLDLRQQQLDKDAIGIICGALRHHPSIVLLNVSDNPLNIAAGAELLELAKTNANLEYILLDNTLVKPTMTTMIGTQLKRNREAKQALKTSVFTSVAPVTPADGHVETAAALLFSSYHVSAATLGGNEPGHATTTPVGSVQSSTMASGDPNFGFAHSMKYLDAKVALLKLPATLHEMLFDINPVDHLASLCLEQRCWFTDTQFPAGNDEPVHYLAKTRYDIASWKRIGEVFPHAQLLPPDANAVTGVSISAASTTSKASEELRYATSAMLDQDATITLEAEDDLYSLPYDTMEGYSWIFSSVSAAVPTLRGLRQVIISPLTDVVGISSNAVGVYAVRVFIDGEWRYVVVDDFFPVDRKGNLVFAPPVIAGHESSSSSSSHYRHSTSNATGKSVYFWPCLLEKALAKMHGGYHALDNIFDHDTEARKTVPGPKEWSEARKPPGYSATCARTMADLTSGVGMVRALHREGFQGEECWRTLVDLLGDKGTGIVSAPTSCSSIAAPTSAVQLVGRNTSGGGGVGLPLSPPCIASPIGGGELCAIAMSRCESKVMPGIEPSHAFQIVQVRHFNGVKLVELANSCPNRREMRWRGDWSEESPLWEQFPLVERALRTQKNKYRQAVADVTNGGGDGATADQWYTKSDGASRTAQGRGDRRRSVSQSFEEKVGVRHSSTRRSSFWMSYADFLRAFEEIHFCRTFPGFHHNIAPGEWGCFSAGGPLSCPTWYSNPHLRLRIEQSGLFFINLCTPDSRFAGSGLSVDTLGFHILEDEVYPLYSNGLSTSVPIADPSSVVDADRSTRVVYAAPYVQTDSVSLESRLPAGGNFWIVPSTYTAGSIGKFFLRIFSSTSFSITPEVPQDHWMMKSVEDVITSSGFYGFGEDNPQICVEVDECPLCMKATSTVDCSITRTNTARHYHNCDRHARHNTRSPALLCDTVRNGTSLISVADSTDASTAASLSRRYLQGKPIAGRVVVKATLTSFADEHSAEEEARLAGDDVGVKPTSMALFISKGVVADDGRNVRVAGPLEQDVVLAQSPHLLTNTVYAEVDALPGDVLNVLCCAQPAKSRAAVQFTVWSSMPLRNVLPMPAWTRQTLSVGWAESGSFYSADGHPQVEIYPAKRGERFVVRMTLRDYSCPQSAILLTFVRAQVGGGITGDIPAHHIIARSEYVRQKWVQCEFQLGEDHDEELSAIVVVPCVQPAGTQATCVIAVSSDLGTFNIRTLTNSD